MFRSRCFAWVCSFLIFRGELLRYLAMTVVTSGVSCVMYVRMTCGVTAASAVVYLHLNHLV